MAEKQVAIIQAEKPEYPENPPFNPPEVYPEYPWNETDSENTVYEAVRDLLNELDMDREHYGTEEWNPLGVIIKPEDRVVIKPNFVSEARWENIDPQSMVTHASVIRPIIDYCLLALKGKGSLIVADAPQTDSNFEKIKETAKIQGVIDYINIHSPLRIDLIDLREEIAETANGVVIRSVKYNGDPSGYTIVDMGDTSAFHPVEDNMDRIYGAYYDVEKVRAHHTRNKHEYCISNTVLGADVIINVPKLKTHIKAGITACLKNMIGINGNKNYLPHYRFGSREEGGDEYLRRSFRKTLGSKFYQFVFRMMSHMGPNQMKLMTIPRKIYALLKKSKITNHNAGSWYGNDTIWRTIADLNRILFYCDKSGIIQEKVQRKYIGIVDGIISGEGEGPLSPSSKPCGIVIGGFDPVLVDKTCAGIMGFDYESIPQIMMAAEMLGTDINTVQDIPNIDLNFRPPEEWKGKLENN